MTLLHQQLSYLLADQKGRAQPLVSAWASVSQLDQSAHCTFPEKFMESAWKCTKLATRRRSLALARLGAGTTGLGKRMELVHMAPTIIIQLKR